MTAPIDPIAVLDSQIAELRASGDTGNVENLIEARETLSELVGFVRGQSCHCYTAFYSDVLLTCERCRLLARCGATP